MVEHTGQTNNNQKEKNTRNKVSKPKTSRQVVVANCIAAKLQQLMTSRTIKLIIDLFCSNRVFLNIFMCKITENDSKDFC